MSVVGMDLDGRNVRWCQEAGKEWPRIKRSHYG